MSTTTTESPEQPSNEESCYYKWTDHQTHLSDVVRQLLEEECMVDVTLVADGERIQAHRIVLCSCSTLFQVKKNSHFSLYDFYHFRFRLFLFSFVIYFRNVRRLSRRLFNTTNDHFSVFLSLTNGINNFFSKNIKIFNPPWITRKFKHLRCSCNRDGTDNFKSQFLLLVGNFQSSE